MATGDPDDSDLHASGTPTFSALPLPLQRRILSEAHNAQAVGVAKDWASTLRGIWEDEDELRAWALAGGAHASEELWRAVLRGRRGTVALLLDKGWADHNALGAALLTAVECGQADIVRLLLQHGADVERKDRTTRRTPLQMVLQGKPSASVVQALLDGGAAVNVRDADGATPLITAVLQRASVEVVRLLLKAGASATAQNKHGMTSLIAAVRCRADTEVVRALVGGGSDLAAQDEDGKTALIAAVRDGASVEVVRALLEGGPSLAVHDKVGKTALHWALYNDGTREEVLGALLEAAVRASDAAAALNAQDKDGLTPLHTAVARGAPEARIRALLQAGAVGTPDKDGMTPLHAALVRGAPESVLLLLLNASTREELAVQGVKDARPLLSTAFERGASEAFVRGLLAAGAPVDAKDKYGLAPCHYAKAHGASEAVLALLPNSRVGDLRSNSRKQEGLLVWAIERKAPVSVVRALLAAGVSASGEGKRSSPPLHAALWSNAASEVVAALLDGGASVEQQDAPGSRRTPLHVALRVSAPLDVVLLLLDRGASLTAQEEDGAAPLYVACERKAHVDVVRALLDRGADANARTKSGSTPLHAAIDAGATRHVVSLLLDRGAPVSAQDEDGAAPLHVACAKGSPADVVRALLDRGADVTALTTGRQTPLHVVLRGTASRDVVSLLLDRGAPLTAQDEDGATPLHVACKDSAPADVVRALLAGGADVNARTTDDNTPLLYACSRRTALEAVVCMLLDAGADPTAQDRRGMQPRQCLAYTRAPPPGAVHALAAAVAAQARAAVPNSGEA